MRKIHTKMLSSMALALFFTAGVGFAGTHLQEGASMERPIEDYVDRQGLFCSNDDVSVVVFVDNRTDPCPDGVVHKFVPPVRNMLGWTDPAADLGAFVDSAGLANDVIGSLGTTFAGEIKEREMADGRAMVTVKLDTSNALIFATQGQNVSEGADNPVVFGNRPDDVIDDAEPALGESELVLVFINPEPGLAMPDLTQLFFFPEAGQELISFRLKARAESEGAEFKMRQVCAAPCDLSVFQKEEINIKED